MIYILLALAGTAGVAILNAAIVYAARSAGHRAAYIVGTLIGSFIGMTLGERLK